MSKELEALKILKANAILFDDGTDFGASMLEAITVLDKAITPPTQEEVCEALSEYRLFDMVEYDKKTQTFYSGDNICCMGIDYQDKPIIILDYELPPHLITLIGRFYEGLEK